MAKVSEREKRLCEVAEIAWNGSDQWSEPFDKWPKATQKSWLDVVRAIERAQQQKPKRRGK